MKKKLFLVVSSLRAGGAEKVFWLLANYIDKSKFEVYLVLLDSKTAFFSLDIPNITIIDLQTVRASKSFFKLLNLIKKEKPDALLSTGGQIDFMVSILSFFFSVPMMIARGASIPNEIAQYASNPRGKLMKPFSSALYKRFDKIVCQSDEMKIYFHEAMGIPDRKLNIIPNPVVLTKFLKNSAHKNDKKLIIVGRLVKEKGHDRLLEILKELPEDYKLTIAGTGPLKNDLAHKIKFYNLENRASLVGQISNIQETIANHDLLVLTSYTEGFPNVVTESISVGVPVVTFKVGGVSSIIEEGFNGYIVPQGNNLIFKESIIKVCEQTWDSIAIKEDAIKRFGSSKIVGMYEALISGRQ